MASGYFTRITILNVVYVIGLFTYFLMIWLGGLVFSSTDLPSASIPFFTIDMPRWGFWWIVIGTDIFRLVMPFAALHAVAGYLDGSDSWRMFFYVAWVFLFGLDIFKFLLFLFAWAWCPVFAICANFQSPAFMFAQMGWVLPLCSLLSVIFDFLYLFMSIGADGGPKQKNQ